MLNAKISSALTCMKAGGRVAEADGGLARLSVESEVTSQWTVIIEREQKQSLESYSNR